jgi:hypothetical protein
LDQQHPPSGGSRAFRARARQEADRYGSDPWVFVRELLQNARDAGATRATFALAAQDGHEVLVCQDDGEGMTFEDARRYLFALYASTKESKKNQVGKFGVGFWSILRFEPIEIVIRSRRAGGAGWGVALDGALERAIAVEGPQQTGTEITLRRPRREGGIEQHVHDAAWQTARYLSRRDDADTPLDIQINGHRINAAFELPAPCAAFRRRNVRGVVGLGATPRVELFSRGLRVRSAARLEDLLAASASGATAGGHAGGLRIQFPELPDGLAPVALLESAELEVMLSRSDVRDTRALAKLVRLAHRELRGLIERQLSVARPSSWWARLRARWDDLAQRGRIGAGVRTLAALGVAAAATIIVAKYNGFSWHKVPAPVAAVAAASAPVASPARAGARQSYQDLGGTYRGPTVDAPDPGDAARVALRYRPARARFYFAALTFSRLALDGAPVSAASLDERYAYVPAPCAGRGCLRIDLVLRSSTRAIRIPVPTGQRVVKGSVKWQGRALPLRATSEGEPLVVLDQAAEGTLRYQTVAAADPEPAPHPDTPILLPPPLRIAVSEARIQPIPERMATLLRLVQQRVVYDDSPATVARHQEALARHEGFIPRTLAIGAGDCDVQNGLLAALAQAAGVPARLAVGYLGARGRLLPRLHAWVEYRDGNHWSVADATVVRPSAAAGKVPAIARTAATTSSRAPTLTLPALADAEILGPAQAAVAPLTSAATTPKKAVPDSIIFLGGGLLLTMAGASLLLRRTRRAFNLDAQVDLAKLLQGVLQQPRAFGAMSALLHRPLVPLADGRAISLAKARSLGHRGRLFCSESLSPLAQKAVRAGAVVVDQRTAEGRTIVDALGAVDLDAWQWMIEAAKDEPLLDDVNRILRRHGEEWAVLGSDRVSGGVAALDLAHVGARTPPQFGTRLVLIDARLDWLVEARRRHMVHPQAAAFMVLDEVARRMGLAPSRRTSLLGECAAAALLECFGDFDEQRAATA